MLLGLTPELFAEVVDRRGRREVVAGLAADVHAELDRDLFGRSGCLAQLLHDLIGHVADHFDRRKILLCTQAAMGVLALGASPANAVAGGGNSCNQRGSSRRPNVV